MTAGLRLVDGPAVAGVEVGAVIAVDVGLWLSVRRTPAGLDVTATVEVPPPPRDVLVRFVDGAWHAHSVGAEPPPPPRAFKVADWSFEFVDDAPLTTTTKRLADGLHHAVAPRRIFQHNGTAISWWTAVDAAGELREAVFRASAPRRLAPAGRGHDVLVADEAVVSLAPLVRGVELQRLWAGHHGAVDDAIAAAIVKGVATVRGQPVVCFDGVVRDLDPRPRKNEDRRRTFARLIGVDLTDYGVDVDGNTVERERDRSGDRADPARLTEVNERFRVARGASVDDVAAFVQSFDAAGCARHEALVEELSLWAATRPREDDAR